MEVARYPDDPRPPRWPHPVLALGNFDGLHRGHIKIIERVRRVAFERGGTALVLTFDPHPPRIVRPDKAPQLLMTLPQKIEALAKAGIHGVAIVTFTHAMSRWEPETFVKTVLVDWLRVSEVWVGADFLFGRDRSGNFSLLRALGGQYGFRAEKIDPVRYKEFVVSSTRVRRLVTEGRVDEAGALLGHHFYIDGTVVRGAGRGRELGIPTANLDTANELIPPHGVYATTATVRGRRISQCDQHRNSGRHSTSEPRTTIETHIMGLDADLYGDQVRLGFVQRLRDERRFPDVDALKAQIEADVRRAGRLFDRLSV